jgi:hypothetical protein
MAIQLNMYGKKGIVKKYIKDLLYPMSESIPSVASSLS